MSDHRSKEAKFFHVLHDVYDIIEKESIDVWLDAGALLKHTRGQNIYPSSDIDFGIRAEDRHQLVKIERSLAKQGYITSAIGELPFFFEGLRAKKAFRLDCYISVDVYVYYHHGNYYFRPNSHKPLKQNRAYALLFIFLVKAARLHFRSKTSAIKYLDNISKFVFNLIAKLYFSFAQTTQFAIPDNFFHSMDKIRVNGKLVNKPRDVQKYLEWRYGCNWKKRNKNWRLTDGSMVFLGGLSSYQRLFLESPTAMSMRAPTPKLDRSAIQSMRKNGKYPKTNANSLFKFSNAEIAKLKKSHSQFVQSTIVKKFENEQ